MVCIWDFFFFSSNYLGLFQKTISATLSSRILYCLVKSTAFATISKSLIQLKKSLFLSKVGVQYPAPGFESTLFKLPLHNVSVCIYIAFVFWNEIKSLSIAQRSCRKSNINLLTISLHANNNLSGASAFELLSWRGWFFSNFCQNPWKIPVKVIIFSKFAQKFGCSFTKNEPSSKIFVKDFENRYIITTL